METSTLKKIGGIIILVLFLALCVNLFGQTTAYPFDVKVSGKGSQSIIFIPGFACSSQVWDETRALYEPHYTCYSLTMAGFAGVAPQKDPTFKGWENAIAGFIRKNGIKSPVIIGHSMGGGLAMALAADYPELVGKIVVVDALPCLSAIMDPGFKSQEHVDCSETVSKITAQDQAQFYRMQKVSMAQLMSDSSHQAEAIDWSMRSDRETFAKMYCDFSNVDLRQKIGTIQCPSLILLEAYFINFKPAIDQQFKTMKPASLQYATRGLHFIMYDDKEWYNRQLAGFIKP